VHELRLLFLYYLSRKLRAEWC